MPLPKGGFDLVVHHVDGNHENDVPENRQVMTRSAHSRLHSLGNQNALGNKSLLGYRHTPEARAKMRAAARRRRRSDPNCR